MVYVYFTYTLPNQFVSLLGVLSFVLRGDLWHTKQPKSKFLGFNSNGDVNSLSVFEVDVVSYEMNVPCRKLSSVIT